MGIYHTVVVAVILLMLGSAGWSADFAKGDDAYDVGDYETANSEWQPLAEEGHADAQFGMGRLFGHGFGVPLDNAQALSWYRLAADQGHADAQCSIAVMHENGWGVPQSDDDAFKWYSLAAEQGVTEAQLRVGKMFSRGYGAPKDNVQAYKWFAIASELGDYGANYKRDSLAEKMSEEEISESMDLAGVWIENHQTVQANQ